MKVQLITILLVCLCCEDIGATHTYLQGEGLHFHPLYTYSCNEDLSITFKGVEGNVTFATHITATPNSTKVDNENCTITPDTNHYGNWKISTECSDLNTYDKTRTLYIAVVDKNEDEFEPTPNAVKISAGHHIFRITCDAIPNQGIERVALAETGVKDLEVLTGIKNQVGQVQILFKEEKKLTSPDVSEVYVGDRFYMFIKYTGDTNQYTIMPTNCTAFKGTYRTTDPNSHVSLWDKSSANCLTQTATQYKIMDTFERLNSTVVYAVMHGFRFTSSLNGGEDDVTIACQVQICTASGTGSCKDTCKITTTSSTAATTPPATTPSTAATTLSTAATSSTAATTSSTTSSKAAVGRRKRRRRNAETSFYRAVSKTIKIKTLSNSGVAIKDTFLSALACIGLSVKYQAYF